MALYRSTVLLVTCATCLTFFVDAATGSSYPQQTGESFFLPIKLAQTNPPPSSLPGALQPGDRGKAVEQLQTNLKQLGFYNQPVDGFYGDTTLDAVAKFQQSVGLTADGIAGEITTQRLQAAVQKSTESIVKTPQPTPNSAKKPGLLQGKKGWLLLGLGGFVLVAIVGGLFYLLMRSSEESETSENQSEGRPLKIQPETQKFESSKQLEPAPRSQPGYDNNGFYDWGVNSSEKLETSPAADPMAMDTLALSEMARLTKFDIVEELITDLQTTDPVKRRKTIWQLGQRGDSRAIQPLVNLLIDSDSQQRSLILAALSEIGSRTLKPMNRALALSLEDDNAEVRKNAIRDLTRIYDLLLQMSQLLRYAADDEDEEVRETARWALAQLKIIKLVKTGEESQKYSDSGVLREDSPDNLG